MCEVADAELLVGERVHETQAQGVRESKEDLDGFGCDLGRRQRRADLLDLSPVGDVGKTHSHS